MAAQKFRIGWRGVRLPAPFRARLGQAGVEVDARPRHDTIATVVATGATLRVPTQPAETDLPWIWLSGAPLSDSLRVQAAQRGAYESISRTDADAVDQLLARLREL